MAELRAEVEAAEGSISRRRLLDEIVAALRREQEPGAARRLTAFHDRLKPSPAELAVHRSEYLRWLESDRDAIAGFALRNLTRLDRAMPLDGRQLLERLGPLVALRAKAHAQRAVLLAGAVADREPALVTAALRIVADALGHESAEVQSSALAILERHPSGVDPSQLAALGALADPALRARLGRLAGVELERRSPPAVVDATDSAGPAPVTPVEDVEELLELASLLMEGRGDADEAERFADGLSRLCDRPVPAGRRKALLRRAKRRRRAIETLTLAWLGWDSEHPPSIGWTGPTEALGSRLTALARRVVERRADVLLSAPTHRGGFVAPDVLAERLARAAVVDDHDLAQALLRLPADGREAAIARALLPPEQALPASRDTVAVLADPAAVALAWHGPDDPWHGFSYKRGEPCCPARMLAAFEPLPAVGQADGELYQHWLSLVWPGRRDLYFGTVLRTLRSWRAPMVSLAQRRQRQSTAFGVMRGPDEPLGPFALQLLALGLVGPDAEIRLAAAEVVADAIATRRLVPDGLGRALAAEGDMPGAVLNRLGAALEHVGALGASHALELQRLLESTLAALGDRRPQLAATLDLLRRLVQEAGTPVSDPAARAWLQALPPGSRSGRLARAALAVAGPRQPTRTSTRRGDGASIPAIGCASGSDGAS